MKNWKKFAAIFAAGAMIMGTIPAYAETIPLPEEETESTTLADKQEITYVLSNEPDGIDPGVTNNSFAAVFLSNCFEGLATYDFRRKCDSGCGRELGHQ